MKKAMINYVQSERNDNLYTPEYAILALIKYLPKNKNIRESSKHSKRK